MPITMTAERTQPIPIYIFDGSDNTATYLDLIGTVTNYESCSFGIAWHGIGQFEIKINRNVTSYASEFQPTRIIMLGNSARNVGVITEYIESFDQDGKQSEIITVKGEELKTLFGRRLVVPPAGSDRYLLTDQAETCIKELVKDQCGADATTARKICGRSAEGDCFQIDTDTSAGANYTISERYNNLRTVLDGISLATGIGYWLQLDATNKKVKLYTGSGVDRTSGQSVNTRAIFKKEWNTARSGNYQYSEIDYKNLAYVGGQGVGQNRTIRTVYDTTEPDGSDRRETFVDARDLSSTTDLDAKGAQVLSETSYSEYIDIIALSSPTLAFPTDYNLGDICTIEGFGGSYDTRLIQAVYVIEAGKYEVEFTFDKRSPTLPSIVAKGKAAEAYNAASVESPYTENGTFIPTVIGSVTPGTQTYTTQYATYQVIGDLVFIDILVTLSAKDASIAGDVRIGGLPFNIITTGNYRGSLTVGGCNGVTFSAGYTQLAGLAVVNDGNVLRLQQIGSGVNTLMLPVSGISATFSIRISGWYKKS